MSCTPLAIVDQPTVKGVTKECHFFLAEVDDADPGPAEHESEWVPLTEAAGRMENASRSRWPWPRRRW